MKNAIRFLTVFFEVITLSALFAHLLEMPAKMELSMDSYLVVQGVYRGWSWLGLFEIAAIVLSIVWLIIDRHKKGKRPLLVIASLFFIISLMIFFMYTYPANQATQNWTMLPEDQWEALRQQWEYSHALRAVLNLTGLSLLIFALMRKRKGSYRRIMSSRIIPARLEEQ